MTISDLDKAIRTGELLIGYKSVVKGLHEGVVKEVFLSSNGKSFLDDLSLIAGETPITVLDDSSRELGVRCKKPFNIAVLGVKKEGK